MDKRFAVDEIIDDVVVLEDIKTGKITNVNKDLIDNPHEGEILIYKDNKYIEDSSEEAIRRKRIMDKFNRLKKNQDKITK